MADDSTQLPNEDPSRVHDEATRRREARRTQTYRTFIRELARLGETDEDFAERAASSVLCLLEQRLTPDEGQQLAAQLPQRIQEMLWRCQIHEGEKPRQLDLDSFLELVQGELELQGRERTETVVRNVFAAVRAQISQEEADDVAAQLPQDLKSFWLKPI